MNEALDFTDGVWPQSTSNACGVENAIALVNYDNLYMGQSLAFNSSSSQTQVESANQSQGASQWGYATGNYLWPDGIYRAENQWAGITNISPDYGTDPRSIAYMAWNYSLNNTFFHNYIYQWEYSHSPNNQPSFAQQVQEATTGIARALEDYTVPVSTEINAGEHSVVVSGVWSANDPDQNWPAQIQGLVFRDPEGNSVTNRNEINFSQWLDGNYTPASGGLYSLYSVSYGNPDDPEPSVGPYTPNPSLNQAHWDYGFNWIQIDENYTNGQYSPDWAYSSPGDAQLFNPVTLSGTN